MISIEMEWSAQLDRRGLTSVVAALSGSEVGIGRGAEFRLFIAGMQNPSRGFVEDWVGRKEAEARAEARAKEAEAKVTEARRHRHNLTVNIVLSILAVVVAIAIAWWFNK